MSVRKQALKYTASALIVAAFIIVASAVFISPAIENRTASSANTTGLQGGTPASLIIQLTDPPVVPQGTTSLNLTYSSVSFLASEPATGGERTTTTFSVSPQGGSATVDLLTLQNVSKTIASANLPNGSTIYSFAFDVTGIGIEVNGSASPVTLATAGSTLTVTLAGPAALDGNSVALLQLNPVVVSTPTGYQMIPSAVGIVRGLTGSDQGQEHIGAQQQLSSEDRSQLESAQGNLTASLSALSVTGNVTTVSVEVNNTGSVPVVLDAVGMQGNFTAAGASCTLGSGDNGTTLSPTTGSSESQANTTTTESDGSGAQSTTATTVSPTSSNTAGGEGTNGCEEANPEEIVFVPVNSTAAGPGCVPTEMQLVTGDLGENGSVGLTLAPGQCVVLTFAGTITYGEPGVILVPSTLSGQLYVVHVIASLGANIQLSCGLPVTATSCSAMNRTED